MDNEFSRRRARREARKDPEFDRYTDGLAATMWQMREDWKQHTKEAAAAWDEQFVNIAPPSGMEVIREDDGTTAYSDHRVEIQRMCRTSAPQVVGNLEVSMVAAQGLDGSLHDAKISITSANNHCVEFPLTSAGALAAVLRELAADGKS